MNPSLHFMLKVRQFIEMVSGQDTAEDETALIRFAPFVIVEDNYAHLILIA